MISFMKIIVFAAAIAWALSPGNAIAQQHGRPDAGPHNHAKAEHDQKNHDSGSTRPLCPVMGDPVDFSIKTMTDDGPVYFCCKMCIKKLEKGPDRYAAKIAAQRAALKKLKRLQVNCPVGGHPIDGKTFAMIRGRGVYFCCEPCVPKYDTEPAKYQAKLEASYTYQTKCPITGEKIKPTVFADLPTGQRVYFCCPGCDKKLLADPEKYAPKLAAQGINLDVKKLEREQRAGDDRDIP